MSFAWLAFPPFQHHPLHGEGIAGCQPDNEGSWSIGVYHGANPFSLQPIEMVDTLPLLCPNDKSFAVARDLEHDPSSMNWKHNSQS
jgi:hypothetical protein